ncbi:phospholipase C accessory protein PlcR [Burkholderia sp. BDU5]|uniref:phospholipase C accessory protein PlcR n=1 Tax=Burkholderia sp. BDU5 TaxID=1385590 RepID=UPI0009E8769C|nr:phospholipase C accessory protein PlcR [Burkholderia sp. BDU5]
MRFVKYLIAVSVIALLVIYGATHWIARKVPRTTAETSAPSGIATNPPPALANQFTDANRRSSEPDIGSASASNREAAEFQHFQAAVIAFQQKRDSLSTETRQTTVKSLVNALPDRVRAGQVLPIQALALGETLLNEANFNPAERAKLSSNLRQQIEDYSARSVGSPPTDDPRYRRYQEQSASAIDDISHTVAPEQQQAAISARLQQLRVQLYDKQAN